MFQLISEWTMMMMMMMTMHWSHWLVIWQHDIVRVCYAQNATKWSSATESRRELWPVRTIQVHIQSTYSASTTSTDCRTSRTWRKLAWPSPTWTFHAQGNGVTLVRLSLSTSPFASSLPEFCQSPVTIATYCGRHNTMDKKHKYIKYKRVRKQWTFVWIQMFYELLWNSWNSVEMKCLQLGSWSRRGLCKSHYSSN